MHNVELSIVPDIGDVYATEFVLSATSPTSIAKYIWNFGDSTNLLYENNSLITHTFNHPGAFTVSVTAVDFDGHSATTTKQITADFVYRDYLRFTQIPEKYPDPGKVPDKPFIIEIVSSQFNQPLVVDLFATNSLSTPFQYIPNRWNFLNPTWKFLDSNFNFVTSLTATPTLLYKNNTVVGVSSTIEFYYVDSIGTTNPVEQCPILITATLQVSGYSNPNDASHYPYPSYANNQTVRTGVLWQVNDLFPTTLKITSNYIDNIQNPQWTDIPTTLLITCHSNKSLLLPGSENSLSEVIFSYPKTNTLGKLAPVNLTHTQLSTTNYTVDEAPLYFQTTDEKEFNSGGYIFTTITSNTTAEQTSVIATTTAYNTDILQGNVFPYPRGLAPNTSIWVSNPERNTLNKITLVPYSCSCPTVNYFIDNKILVDGQIKEVQIPYSNSTNTFNYEMSGFSGIYGIAIDPREHDIIACDSELDRLYRISNTGEILKTYELSSLGDYDPFKKMMDYWHFITPQPELSATRYALYNTTPLSRTNANYIAQIGDQVQLIVDRIIDVYGRLFVFTLAPNYPAGNQDVEIVQLFSPALPNEYRSTLAYWITSLPTPQTNIFLYNPLSAIPLSDNSNYYFVTINGLVQNPDTYSVDVSSITFTSLVSANTDVQILYMPMLNQPYTEIYTFSEPVTSINLTSLDEFLTPLPWNLNDPQCSFIIAVSGVYQSPRKYRYNYDSQTITFTNTIPASTEIRVTQLSIPDKVNIPQAYTPSYISLDKDYNIWVSLFNSISVLKFDENFNLLHTVTPSGVSWLKEPWTNYPQGIDYQFSKFGATSRYINNDPNIINPNVEPYELFVDEYFLKPPVVETDKDNNCWVTYAHPLCCIVAKYSSSGNLLGQISLPKYTIPMGVAITPNNNAWVVNSHNSSYTYTSLSGSIQLYDTTTYEVLSTIVGFSRPQYIALDRNSNVWFTHGQRRIGYIDSKTSSLSMWTLELTGGFTPYVIPTAIDLLEYNNADALNEDEDLNGLAVDVFDRVWLIDGLNNNIWVLSATPHFTQSSIRYFKARPNSTVGYYIDLETGETYTESKDVYYKSVQATGDWTGNRWYQKYINPQSLSSIQLSGISEPFNITPFENSNQIRRINESFNMSDYFRTLALPEKLYSNEILFKEFLGAAVGTSELSAYEDLGQIIYEKIANFVTNHADVDTCNIDQLLSLAEMTDTAASDYGAEYPSDIRRLLDILSINRSRLFGIKDEIPILPRSTGYMYNTQTDYITADTKIILRNKFDQTHSLIPVPPQDDGTLIYPLSEFVGWGFIQPVLTNYQFFALDPQYENNYVNNLIDWDSPYTLLSPTVSSFEEWYGPGGAIENLFRYVLTKNLFTK